MIVVPNNTNGVGTFVFVVEVGNMWTAASYLDGSAKSMSCVFISTSTYSDIQLRRK